MVEIRVGSSIPGRAKSKIEKLTPIVSLTGWDIMSFCGMLLASQTWLQFGSVTENLTTTVEHSYKSLRNDVKSIHSLNHSITHFKYVD